MASPAIKRLIASIYICLVPLFCDAQDTIKLTVPEDGRSKIFADIKKGASEIHTIVSDFTQEKRSAMLRDPLRSQGKFYFIKPDRLRWEFVKPSSSGFIISKDNAKRWKGNPSELHSFEVKNEPAIRATSEQVFAWTRGDFAWLEKRYRITISGTEPPELRLKPLSSDERKFLKEIVISFSVNASYVTSIDIIENTGDSTRIRFMNTRLNQSLSDNLF